MENANTNRRGDDMSAFAKFNQWARNSFTLKFFTICFLILIMLIPMLMIQSVIEEREMNMMDAREEVMQKWGGTQLVTGPVISIPYNTFSHDKDGRTVTTTHYMHFLPEALDEEIQLSTQSLHRGIYDAVVYKSELEVSGFFKQPDIKLLNGVAPGYVLWDKAKLCIGMSDLRGIQEQVILDWNGRELMFEPGVPVSDVMQSGISVPVEVSQADSSKAQYHFKMHIKLNGSEEMQFVPVGRETNISMQSAWPHPSFDGAYIPDHRDVQDSGFTADWKILHLNRNFPQQWTGAAYRTEDAAFGVNLMIPVDQYHKSMRSSKYAILIIALTFLVFFFVEVLAKRRIHPIQYLLVGLGLSLFYLLLLSFSEKIGFDLSYLVAGLATIVLITAYAYAAFKHRLATLLQGLTLVGLYLFIYTIIQLEDLSLLIGSIGLFVILGVLMYLSRKVKWYGEGGEIRQ